MPKCDFNKVALQLLQPSRGVLKKSCSENMQQIYRRTPMPKYDFRDIKNSKLNQKHIITLNI